VSGYGLELDDAEHARLRAQAAGVHLIDADLWPLAVLIHNGDREQEIVDHAASLVRAGGRVLLYDLDSTMIRIAPPTAPVSELHERYLAYQRARGNDPAVGLRLPELLESAGLALEAFRGICHTRARTPGQRGYPGPHAARWPRPGSLRPTTSSAGAASSNSSTPSHSSRG
jgi:hypothetical protein